MNSLILNHVPVLERTPINALAMIERVEAVSRSLPQEKVATTHYFHAGIYTRKVTVKAGLMITGTLIKVPTMLTVSGRATVFTGEGWLEINGCVTLAAEAGRKQIFACLEDTDIIMSFATDAKTVEEAEAQFTDEADLLVSRKEGYDNIIITGKEKP